MKKLNSKGSSPLHIVLILVIVGLIAGVGYYVYSSQKKTNQSLDNAAKSQADPQKSEKKEEVTETDPNEGYLVLKEWGLRFKVPKDITDIQYRVYSDTVAFYAKPVGYEVNYRSDYEKLVDDKYPQYAIGKLNRSNESTKDVIGVLREGKKVGDYYYYTGHAFSSLATGAAPTGIYLDVECDKDTNATSKCEQYLEAERKAFKSVNQGDTALLNTIELAK